MSEWKGNKDDFTKREGDYILRTEQMGSRRWWWAVSYKGNRIGSGFEDTKEEARRLAESVMSSSSLHRKINKI